MGGSNPSGGKDNISFVTISTTGDVSDFGDMQAARHTFATGSNSTRGMIGGGRTPDTASGINTIDFVTIATLGNATNFGDLISVRIAIGSGTAFLVAQLLDVQIFDKLRKKEWFVAPLTSSLIGSTIDTFLFFSISFYATGIPWVTLSLGDLAVKIFVALVMLIPFRLLLGTLKSA